MSGSTATGRRCSQAGFVVRSSFSFPKHITTNPPASADQKLLADHYRCVLHQFNEAFDQHRRVIASLFEPHGCRVTAMSTEEIVPITVKASHELAQTLVSELKKGVAFVVEGQLAYYKKPETNRENYSIWADNFTDITPPKSTATKAA